MNGAKNTKELEEQYADGLDEFRMDNNHCGRKVGWETLSRKVRFKDPQFNIIFDDEKRNNERYLEINHSWWSMQSLLSILSVPMLVVGGMMLLILFDTLFGEKFYWSMLILSSVSSTLFLGGWFYLVHKGVTKKGVLIRYNRQAQLVHLWYEGKFTTYPWKAAAAYQGLTPSPLFPTTLMLHFPGNKQLYGNDRPVKVGASFIDGDRVSARAEMNRWETIRRYMEEGLEAVQPTVEKKYQYPLSKLDLRSQKSWSNGFIQYYLFMGWYIERVVKKKLEAFRWSDDIEAMCAPDAKEKGLLDGFDTTPIKPTTEEEI